ncbi:aspartic peptidase domain-containing protein [Gongronella butleri]|nr:aspartic peptidase domain-containing protein [Gongronella butleri]
MHIGTSILLVTTVASAVLAQDTIRVPLLSRPREHASTLGKREALYNANGREYMIQVGIGSPAQTFNLTLDTGSSDLWVPSTSCPKASCPYARFDTKASSTFTQSTVKFDIQYGQGSAKGMYGYDTVTIGDKTVSSQMIGLANDTKDILGQVASGVQANGIFGLGYPGLNAARGVKNDNPFVFNLWQQQLISQPVFSIFLNSVHATGPTGEITFGGIDATKFNGELQYVPVVSYNVQSNKPVSPNVGNTAASTPGSSSGNTTTSNALYLYWTVPGAGISTSTGYSTTFKTLQPFVLDTGTTLTYMPKTVVTKLVATLPGKVVYDAFNMVYTVDCSQSTNTATTVNFQLGTSAASGAASAIQISVPMAELVMPLDTDDVNTAKQCMFAIAPMTATSASSPTYILGESTLRSVYQVYDLQNNRVGLAPASPNGNGNGVVASSSTSSGAPAGESTSSGSTISNQQHTGAQSAATRAALADMASSVGLLVLGAASLFLLS